MANVSVFNMEGKEVGTIELSDAVFGAPVNEHLVHMAVVQQLANNRQGTQKALETEGNRSCKAGFNESTSVEGRRRGIRSRAERLFLQAQQEGKEGCAQISSYKQGAEQ